MVITKEEARSRVGRDPPVLLSSASHPIDKEPQHPLGLPGTSLLTSKTEAIAPIQRRLLKRGQAKGIPGDTGSRVTRF